LFTYASGWEHFCLWRPAIISRALPSDDKYVRTHNCHYQGFMPDAKTVVIWGMEDKTPDHDIYRCEGVYNEIALPHMGGMK
jgi:hypothetical protein